MPIGSITPTHPKLREKDFKTYFHFDRWHDRSKLESYIRCPSNVVSHSFFPLLLFKEEWTKFRINGIRQKKVRPLRYAARADAAIFAYYRSLFSPYYENELARRGIERSVIAYRKISKSSGVGNKCNIDFARDAFNNIRLLGNCDVTILDISSYFESLDHGKLKRQLELVLGRSLSEDERAVFNAATNYSVVDRKEVFNRLALFEKDAKFDPKKRKGKIDYFKENGWRQICSPKEFRDLIAGKSSSSPSLIRRNNTGFGIPQGTPISDLFANIYLLQFDHHVARWARKRGGFYYRYCDDIILILPRKNGQPFNLAKDYISNKISKEYPELKLKEQKIAIGRFIRLSTGQIYTHIQGKSSINGLEYLGFQFDGMFVSIRNSTMSNAWRKLKRRSHGWAKRWVKQNSLRGRHWIIANAPINDKVTEAIKYVKSVSSDDYKEITFRGYVERSKSVFSDFDTKFESQIKRYKKLAHSQFELALHKAIRTYL